MADPFKRAKQTSIQAYKLEVRDVIFFGVYSRIISKEIVGGTEHMPVFEFRMDPLEHGATADCLVLRARSDAYVTRMLWIDHTIQPVKLPVLHLVSCVSTKLEQPTAARSLYCSPWFRFARAHVEQGAWAILSAKHGLVAPSTVIAPYDATLGKMPAPARRQWADQVLRAMPAADRYVLWAGQRYAEHLADPLHAELPLQGLGIGQQLAYFKHF